MNISKQVMHIGITGSSGGPGITGSSGIVGSSGVPGFPTQESKHLILCIKDSGFFKQDEYYKVFLLDSERFSDDGWRRITIASIDKSDVKVFKPEEFDSIFLYGDKLRDKKLTDILNEKE
jgi:hypothetical protein